MCVPPPRTTKPVIAMNTRIISLTAEIRFISRSDHLLETRQIKARKVYAARASPLLAHSPAEYPAARYMYRARTTALLLENENATVKKAYAVANRNAGFGKACSK